MVSFNAQYDLVVLGATGYTGKLCAEHITTHLPTNLKWAVAGRSASKLQDLVNKIKPSNPDRLQPGVLPVQLNRQELDGLAKKTKVLLNCVGPYYLYSTPVVEACALNGTHYLDVTGETPWVREIVSKYHAKAQSSGAVIIPSAAFESLPSDLIAYTAVTTVRRSLNSSVSEVVNSVHDVKFSGFSGGTLSSILNVLDHYSLSDLQASMQPWSLSPSPPQDRSSRRPFWSKIFGPFSYPFLGILTDSFAATSNEAVVYRTAALMPELYGPHFRFAEYMRVSNYAAGVLVHLGLGLAMLLLSIRPFRWLLKKIVFLPGQGPTAETFSKDYVEFRAVAVPTDEKQKRAMVKFRWDGGIYYLTGLLLAEAAMVLLKEEKELVKTFGGGVLTPACLGDKLTERLQGAGVRISTEIEDA